MVYEIESRGLKPCGVNEEVLDLWEKSEAKRKNTEAGQQTAQEQRIKLTEQGKLLFAKHIPAEAKALIIAEHNQDESDVQSDYHGHQTIETVVLGYSLTERINFGEMRKMALRIPETRHLGPGKGHFEPRVIIDEDIISDGSYYHKGQYSHWHRKLTEISGRQVVFSTKQEAEKYITEKGQPNSISFDGKEIPFIWRIEEDEIEHRENYSMGGGYYLKDGHRDNTGWSIHKRRKYGASWPEDLCLAMAKRCLNDQ